MLRSTTSSALSGTDVGFGADGLCGLTRAGESGLFFLANAASERRRAAPDRDLSPPFAPLNLDAPDEHLMSVCRSTEFSFRTFLSVLISFLSLSIATYGAPSGECDVRPGGGARSGVTDSRYERKEGKVSTSFW